jgi:transposase
MAGYRPRITQAMKKYYATLGEKDRRRYSAVEAMKLGSEGVKYITQLLGCSEKTVRRGIEELESLSEEPPDEPGQRQAGGGRKGYAEHHSGIDEQFLKVLDNHSTGSPMNEQVIWTDLTPQEIAERLEQDYQVNVSKTVIRKLLKKHQFCRRKAQKKQTLKSVPERDAQFGQIAAFLTDYRLSGNPIISFDTKKKEFLGNFYREGRLYTQQVLKTLDHDSTSLVDGIIIPHGIYDLQHNIGYLHLGTSKDTSQFACDCIRSWWLNHGQTLSPMPPRSWVYVMAAAPTVPCLTSSKKIYKNWRRNWALKSVLPTSRSTVPSSIRLSIACFHMSRGLVRELPLPASPWSNN